MAASSPEDILVPYERPGRPAPLTQVRSTLIVSALQVLRARGLFDAYQANLDPDARVRVNELIAGQWIPAELALRHYRAADALKLDTPTIESLGADVAERTSKTLLHTAVKMSKSLGVTPWIALGMAHRIREASWKGTDLCVVKLGPKEARYEWIAQPCAGVPYFARSFNGFIRALLGLFCTKVYSRPLASHCTPTSLVLHIAWA